MLRRSFNIGKSHFQVRNLVRFSAIGVAGCGSYLLGHTYIINTNIENFKISKPFNVNKLVESFCMITLKNYGKSEFMPNSVAINMLECVRKDCGKEYDEKYDYINCLNFSAIEQLFRTDGLNGLRGLVTNGATFNAIIKYHQLLRFTNFGNTHHNLTYKPNALNIDPNEFNPKRFCDGGMYFTDISNGALHIVPYVDLLIQLESDAQPHMYWYNVTIPPTAKIQIEPNGKGKTSEFILGNMNYILPHDNKTYNARQIMMMIEFSEAFSHRL